VIGLAAKIANIDFLLKHTIDPYSNAKACDKHQRHKSLLLDDQIDDERLQDNYCLVSSTTTKIAIA